MRWLSPFCLCALLAMLSPAAANSIFGLWATEKNNGRVLIELCGKAICGRVVDGNQLISLRDSSKPCTDTHGLCAPPPFPPLGPNDPAKSCTIVTTQTLMLDGVKVLTRTHTYTFVQTATACTLTLN